MKFYIHKLGCPKNDVDADYISARLIAEGHEPVATPEDAETIIVNTCGFILPAKEESIQALLQLSRLKNKGKLKTIYVAGCLSQRNGDELLKGMPELDGAFGLGELDSIANTVGKSLRIKKTIKTEANQLEYLGWNDRYIDNEKPFAYLKISDGCNRLCSYCAIPSIRGKYRSRSMESILKEAAYLARNGKKELILVSQEATLYGYDYKRDKDINIITLLKELDKIEGVAWIRLMYLYPSQINDELIEYMADNNKTLNYFDLPLQHVNNDILKAMCRQTERKEIEKLIDTIKTKSPKATIRTTFIVGFPGETEKQFKELEEFVSDYKFDRMGVFTYSLEEGTPAAKMENQIPENIKIQRMDKLMTIQQEIAFAKNNSLIGKKLNVIIDSINENNLAQGRSEADCPEIDQEVIINGNHLSVGDIHQAEIVAVEGYDLKGIIKVG